MTLHWDVGDIPEHLLENEENLEAIAELQSGPPRGGPGGSHLEEEFADKWKSICRKKFKREYRFDPVRRWRFDFAWPKSKVAVEIEGGVWTQGRHTRGAGYLADLEKYNTAAVAGWLVIRLADGMIDWPWLDVIKEVVDERYGAA